ncbi:MAG: NUDIX domain-containing protein [Clostridiales bacterium]|nr:NUDIX domain-containing protein [Clostridiales bacterium]
MLKEYVKEITIDTTLTSEINLKKGELLESKKPSTKETIIYYREDDLTEIPSGFSKSKLDLIKHIPIYSAKRSLLEYLPMQRHPIPYCVIRNKDKYFLAFREGGSGEARLIGKKGLLGGHVAVEDLEESIEKTFIKSLLRELKEEADINESDINNISFLGFIKNTEKDTVEFDHLGLIYLVDINNSNIETIEEGVLSGDWFTKEEILLNIDSLESWSKIIFLNADI